LPEDDAALRATLAQIVLADLQAARSPLSPPAVAALRILASAPATTRSGQVPARPAGCSLRRAGVAAGFGVGVAAVAGAVFLATGSDAPRPLPQAAPAEGLPADLTPVPADGRSVLPAPGTPVLVGPSATTAPSSVAGPVGLPVPGIPAAATSRAVSHGGAAGARPAVPAPASRAAVTIPAATTRTETNAAAAAPARTGTAVPSSQPLAPPTAGPGPSAGPTTAEPTTPEPTTPEPTTPEPTTPEPTTPGPEAAPSDAGPATEDATASHRAADRADARCPPGRGDPSGQP
jgi:hypothetical protein